MLKLTVLLAALALSSALPFGFLRNHKKATNGEDYAVLVAGSNTWDNYRHQADVCHAYQVLIEKGFKKENIITFMYDDLANNIENPTKGKIINKPNGPDVYAGIVIDYKGAEVIPQNFLNVIKGDAAAMKGKGSGRVLQSTAADNVFINFVDHGGPGIIAFPNDVLQATDLIAALQYMNTNKMYNQLVFYLEACESGSMFSGLLPNNINIFATTASDPTSSSYACYYDNLRHTYLGDVYSVNWMEDCDAEDITKETLAQQYAIVKQETNTSTVCEYGDISISSQPVSNFLGAGSSAKRVPVSRDPKRFSDAVSSRLVDVEILKRRIAADPTNMELRQKMIEKINKRQTVRFTFEAIIELAAGFHNVNHHMSQRLAVKNLTCVESCTVRFHNKCFNLGQEHYALEHTFAFVSMCEEGIDASVIHSAIDTVCNSPAARAAQDPVPVVAQDPVAVNPIIA